MWTVAQAPTHSNCHSSSYPRKTWIQRVKTIISCFFFYCCQSRRGFLVLAINQVWDTMSESQDEQPRRVRPEFEEVDFRFVKSIKDNIWLVESANDNEPFI